MGTKNEDELQIFEQGELQQIDVSHFESQYKDGGNISIRDQINVLKEHPKLFFEGEGEDIFLPLLMDEVKYALKASTR